MEEADELDVEAQDDGRREGPAGGAGADSAAAPAEARPEHSGAPQAAPGDAKEGNGHPLKNGGESVLAEEPVAAVAEQDASPASSTLPRKEPGCHVHGMSSDDRLMVQVRNRLNRGTDVDDQGFSRLVPQRGEGCAEQLAADPGSAGNQNGSRASSQPGSATGAGAAAATAAAGSAQTGSGCCGCFGRAAACVCCINDSGRWLSPKEGFGIHCSAMCAFGMVVVVVATVLIVADRVTFAGQVEQLKDLNDEAVTNVTNMSVVFQLVSAEQLSAGLAKAIAYSVRDSFVSEADQVVSSTVSTLDAINVYTNESAVVLGASAVVMLQQLASVYITSAASAALLYLPEGLEQEGTLEGSSLNASVFMLNKLGLEAAPAGLGISYDGVVQADSEASCIKLNNTITPAGPCSIGNLSVPELYPGPLRAQAALAAAGTTEPLALWSNLITNPDFSPTDISAANWTLLAYGVAYSWPLNLCPSNSYECFRGALYCVLPSAALSALLASELEMLRLSFGKSAGRPDAFSAYMVVRNDTIPTDDGTSQVGWLAGAAVGDESKALATAVFVQPGDEAVTFRSSDLQPDLDSSVVSESSSALLRYFDVESFAASVFADSTVIVANLKSGEPCDVSALVDTIVSNSGLTNCTVIATQALSTADAPQRLVQGSSLEWLSVVTIPLESLLGNYTAVLTEVKHNIESGQKEVDEELDRQLGVSVALAVISVLAALLIAYFLSGALVSPIKRLEQFVQQVTRLEFLDSGAVMAPTRIREVQSLQAAFGGMYGALKTFARFVPSTVVQEIVRGENRVVRVRRREVTIMFSDIQGFTSIAEELQVEDLLFLITSYLSAMTRIVEEYEGVVAEIQGDGLLAYFNTPDDVEDHCTKALSSALAQQEYLKTFSQRFKADLGTKYPTLSDFKVRIGIHTGEVLTGIIGSDLKMKFGCMGDPVNAASRLEGLCKLYGVQIMCSQATLDGSKHKASFLTRELDTVQVKGKAIPMRIFQVLSQSQPIRCNFSVKRIVAEDLPGKRRSRDPLPHSSTEATSSSRPADAVSSGAMRSKASRWDQFKWGSTLDRFGGGGDNPRMTVKTELESRLFHPESLHLPLGAPERCVAYEHALRAFRRGELLAARDALVALETAPAPLDMAEALLLERVRAALRAHGDADIDDPTWHGVNKLDAKSF